MRRLVVVTIALASIVSACADDDDDASDGTASTATITTTTISEPTTTGAVATTTTSIATTTSVAATTTSAMAAGVVEVSVDGEDVPLETVCAGADGAVVAVSDVGRLIILVREEGLALRLSTEGETFAETGDVSVTELPGGARYEGTVVVEGQPTPVRMDISDDLELTSC